jgi:hypothetical protein
MRKLGLSLLLLLAVSAHAQVSVEVVLEQEQFLPNETLPIAVRISNQSGRTLALGEDNDWLSISVESRENFVVRKTGDVSVAGKFSLESSKTATKRLDLAPHFSLTKPGRYKVNATVHVKGLENQFTSKPKTFEIVAGTKLWEQEFGLPGASGDALEVRKYVLQQANYLKQLRLYFRLTDATDSKTLRVFPVGPIVSVSRPQPQLDRQSNLHLLWQTSARIYTYIAINPDGDVLLRQMYEMAGNSRPRLQMDTEGKFFVVGGSRRITRDDIPQEKPLSNESESPKS